MSYWEPVLRCPYCREDAEYQPYAEQEGWNETKCGHCGCLYSWTAVATLEFKTITNEQLKRGHETFRATKETDV